MRSVSEELASELHFGIASLEEAFSSNQLLPRVPGWDLVEGDPERFARWLQGQLRSGFATSPEIVVSTRKAGHGVRPFAIWGAAERVLYRAIVSRLLREIDPPDRSVAAYRTFIQAPIVHAASLETSRRRSQVTANSSSVRYVVKSDIVGFYQYIDHEVLANELLLVTGEYDLVELLIEFLREVQGRGFGLPQGSEVSDRLADIYIDIPHRTLLSRGIAVWRYNDDFRMACTSYTEALQSIEDLDAAARDVGLVISEHKTTTPMFSTYVKEVLGVAGDAVLAAEIDQTGEDDDEEGDDYTDVGTVSTTDALAFISATRLPTKGTKKPARDIRRLSSDDVRQLRLSWNSLRRAGDDAGVAHVGRFFSYTPALTAHLARYLITIAEVDVKSVATALHAIVDRVSFNDWQRGWIVEIIADAKMVERLPNGAQRRRFVAWLRELSADASAPLLQAQAWSALAKAGLAKFADVERAMRSAPEVLKAWYIEALGKMSEADPSLSQQFAASLSTSGLHRWLEAQ